jgi:hypothetical protein
VRGGGTGEEHLRGLGDGVCEGVEEAVCDHKGWDRAAVEICVVEAGERLEGLRGGHVGEDKLREADQREVLDEDN